ncbi:MAG: TonB family protein [Planctomycetes bacterium]|nr:TonB family protein [Planctomycetota bacterium]
MTSRRKSTSFLREVVHRLRVLLGAGGLTLAVFLVLPLMQTISKPPSPDLFIQEVDTADLPPPPPPPPEEDKPPEAKPDDKPPELAEEAPPLDLSQLELALNPGFGEGAGTIDTAVSLKLSTAAASEDAMGIFSLADLDQKPRVIYQPGPAITSQVRRKVPGTVYIIFVVDERGRVTNPLVQKSSDSVFEEPALAAVKQWKFEPGKRNGQNVRFRMRVPITFPKGL